MRQLKPPQKTKESGQNKNKNAQGGGGNNQNKQNQDGIKRESSFVQGTKKKQGCWACGKPTCHSGNCDIADDIPRNQWYDKTGIMHYQNAEDTVDSQDNSEVREGQSDRSSAPRQSCIRNSCSERHTQWSMHQVHRVHNQNTRESGDVVEGNNQKPIVITLDSATTKSLFCNEDLVNNRRKSKHLTEISTNTGTGVINEEADVPGFREVMFSEDAIANLFALNELCEKY